MKGSRGRRKIRRSQRMTVVKEDGKCGGKDRREVWINIKSLIT